MNYHLLQSYRDVYCNMLKHGRFTNCEETECACSKKVKKGRKVKHKWAHDNSPRAVQDFLSQFSKEDRARITAGYGEPVEKRRSNIITTLLKRTTHLSKEEKERLLLELAACDT